MRSFHHASTTSTTVVRLKDVFRQEENIFYDLQIRGDISQFFIIPFDNDNNNDDNKSSRG